MFEAFANVKITGDKSAEIKKLLETLADQDVLVGIPEEDSSRENGQINNAELAYIHTHGIRAHKMRADMQAEMNQGTPYSKAYDMYIQSNGSPLWNSPPRPIIEPAIEDSKELIAEQMKNAVLVALDGNDPTAELEKAGMLGQSAARNWFTNPKNNWPANSPGTIKRKGSANPLIDTGELRKSITYVIRAKR